MVYFLKSYINGGFISEQKRIQPYTLVGPTVTRPVQDSLPCYSSKTDYK